MTINYGQQQNTSPSGNRGLASMRAAGVGHYHP